MTNFRDPRMRKASHIIPVNEAYRFSLSTSSNVCKEAECIPVEYRVPCKVWYKRMATI